MEPPSAQGPPPQHRRYPIIQRRHSGAFRLRRLGVAAIISIVLGAGLIVGLQLLGSWESANESGLGPIEQAQATAGAQATDTAEAQAPPTPTIVIPAQAQVAPSPSWHTLAELGPTGSGSNVSGKFLVRAGAKARLSWTCISAVVGNTDGVSFACTADVLNARTGKRVSILADVAVTGQGIYTFPVSASDILYVLRIDEQNTTFTALYQVYQ